MPWIYSAVYKHKKGFVTNLLYIAQRDTKVGIAKKVKPRFSKTLGLG